MSEIQKNQESEVPKEVDIAPTSEDFAESKISSLEDTLSTTELDVYKSYLSDYAESAGLDTDEYVSAKLNDSSYAERDAAYGNENKEINNEANTRVTKALKIAEQRIDTPKQKQDVIDQSINEAEQIESDIIRDLAQTVWAEADQNDINNNGKKLEAVLSSFSKSRAGIEQSDAGLSYVLQQLAIAQGPGNNPEEAKAAREEVKILLADLEEAGFTPNERKLIMAELKNESQNELVAVALLNRKLAAITEVADHNCPKKIPPPPTLEQARLWSCPYSQAV